MEDEGNSLDGVISDVIKPRRKRQSIVEEREKTTVKGKKEKKKNNEFQTKEAD